MGTVRVTFDRELESLRSEVLRLSEMVDFALLEGVRALERRNWGIAEKVKRGDEEINQLRFHIEEKAYLLLATQQPTAGDMRQIVAAVSMATNLERMGDHSAGIATLTLRMLDVAECPFPPEITQMVAVSRELLRDTMKAYRERDAIAAQAIGLRDDEVDALHDKVVEDLIYSMNDDVQHNKPATYLMWTAHNVERFADGVTNLCERIIYVETGTLMEFSNVLRQTEH